MGNFTPNTELYGRNITVHKAVLEEATDIVEGESLKGRLIEIRGPHDYLIELPNGDRQTWTCDSVDDLEILDSETLALWNAFR